MEAYCVKCKEKREMQEMDPTFTSSGTPATRGVCAVCRTGLYRMGKTDAHQGLTPPEVVKTRRKKEVVRRGKLVIVESPAKARTVARYLGNGYTVQASVGHVRDLLRSQLSVDVENDFEPRYRVPNEKREVVKALKRETGKAEEVYLATDPDREGEAIAWHLLEAAEIEPERAQRVVFHEITKSAIIEAFKEPRSMNMDLVDAQQARRVLDRLVGYKISPLLWAKVRSRLSAGRVQSVALRMVVDREEEIRNFVPVEYWSIDADFLQPQKPPQFRAALAKMDDEKPELGGEAQVAPVLEDLRAAGFRVANVKRGSRRRNPQPPYTTSTLQQDASRRRGYTARRTMALAQQLYEGIELGVGEPVGLITYMRTDSVQVSSQAQQEARQVIGEVFGSEHLPDEPPTYKTRAKRAQEAHEAIRPTSAARTPKSVKPHLSTQQYKLYSLIWDRFIASQMRPAEYDTLTIVVEGSGRLHRYEFRQSASSLRYPGFLVVYGGQLEEQNGDANGDGETQAALEQLPDLEPGDLLDLLDLFPEQHFTQPPARYSEASLVRALEEHGIGRPSTYAPILTTLKARGYVLMENKRLEPTEIGELVNSLLVEHFPGIVDLGFTARMEEDLDEVAAGERNWVEVVGEFYGPFEAQVARAEEAMPEVRAEPEMLDRACPTCGKPLLIRYGRFGKFIGCSDFPTCRFTEPWLEKIGVLCPLDQGEIVMRRTRKGRVFYGCAHYPACEFTSWKRPLPQPCSQCSGLIVIENRRQSSCTACGHKEALPDEEPETA